MKKIIASALALVLGIAIVPMTSTAASAAEGTFTQLYNSDWVNEGAPFTGGVLNNAGDYIYTGSGTNVNTLNSLNLTTNTNTVLYTLNPNKSQGDWFQSQLAYDSVDNAVYGVSKVGGHTYTVWNTAHTISTWMDLGVLFKYDFDTSTFTALDVFNDTTGGSTFDMTFDPVSRKLFGLGQVAPGTFEQFGNGQEWTYQVDTATFEHFNLPTGISSGLFPRITRSTTTGLLYVNVPSGSGDNAGGQIYSIDPATNTFNVLKNYSATEKIRAPETLVVDDSVSPALLYISSSAGQTGTAQGGLAVMNADGTGYQDLKYYADPTLGVNGNINIANMFRHAMFFYGCRIYVVAPYGKTAANASMGGLATLYREPTLQSDWASFDQFPTTGANGAGVWNPDTLKLVGTNVTGPYQYQLNTANQHCNFAKVKAPDATINYGDAIPANLNYSVDPTTPVSSWATEPTCDVYALGGSGSPLTGTLAAGTYTTKCAGGVLGASETYDEIHYGTGTLTVNKVTPTITFTGQRYRAQGVHNLLGLAISVSPAACVKPGNLRWSGTPDPRTFGFGPYLVDTNADVDTLLAGTYTFTAYFNQSFSIGNNNESCNTATTSASVQIGGTPPLPSVTVATPGNQNYTYGSTPSLDLSASATLDSDGSDFTDWTGGTAPSCGVFTNNTYNTAVTPSATTPAGTYVIHCSAAVDTSAYSLSVGGDATLTVNKAALSVTANAQSILAGTTAPGSAFYTFTYAGFVNSENGSNLTTAPTCSTAYTNATASGSSLTITCSGGVSSNYTITYNTATLSVTDPTIYVVPDAKTVTYGAPVPSYTFTYYSDLAHTTVANPTVITAPTCSSSYSPTTPVSASTLTISCGDGSIGGGYTLDMSATALLTINELDAGVTYNGDTSKTIQFGDTVTTVNLSAALDPTTGTCVVTFTLTDATPTVFGPYTADSSVGAASYSVDLPAGTYTVDTEVSGNCSTDSDSDTLTVSATMLPFAPLPPTVEPGDGLAKVSPNAGLGGPTPTSYIITAGPDGGSCEVVLPATSCVITGLTNGKQYSFTSVAKNADGSSEPSAEALGTPFGSAATGGKNSLTIHVKPTSFGKKPARYVVTAQPGGAFCRIKAPATSCVIDGLKPGTNYALTVDYFDAEGHKFSTSTMHAKTQPMAQAVIASFEAGQHYLTTGLKTKLDALALKLKGQTSITCIGSTSGPTVKSTDRKLALNRAKVSCSYLKEKVKSIKSFVVEAQTTTIDEATIRRVVVGYYPR